MGTQFHQRFTPDYGTDGFEDGDDSYDAPPSYTATLESVRLGTDEDNIQLLNQVDQLRECRVDEYIELPQIVVVGDQSTGKSSILDALTEIPFPRDSVKCTRFATQIRLRRSNAVSTVVGIIPDKSRPSEERQRLAGFKQTLKDETDFATIFDKAIDAIFPRGSQNSFLANDILSIEISGPKQPHLTVVDLPGIIHAATMNQTVQDKDAILSLAKSYMQRERTIILPVVSCSNDISNQVVLEMAKELDPEGIRTLGIITKPDMTLTKERETEFINLASNKDRRNRLLLGWHVLRNRSHEEGHFTPEQRGKKEKEFFANSNWGTRLRKDQLGVDALSKRLSTQLIRHIAAEVFKVQADIERELEKCKEKLLQLGEGKDTPEEMRVELFRWCERSVRLTHAAVQGHGINPSGEDFLPSFDDGKTYTRNFRSRVVKKNRAFAKQMEDWGAACVILDDEESQNRRTPPRKDETRPRLPEMTRNEYLQKEVYPLLEDNPGKELPMDNNPLLVFRLFQSYSRNWSAHAEQHIRDIHELCEEFLFQVLYLVWPKQIQSRVWTAFIQSEVKSRLEEAEEELKNLKDDRMRFIAPYQSEFLKKYYDWKGAPRVTEDGPVELPLQKYEDVLQKMLFLYESNLKTFIANIIVQVVERHLADDLEKVFHESRVRSLSDREVETLVQDDYQVRTERQELRAQVETLEKGKVICRQIGMRPDLGPYEYQDPNFRSRDTKPSRAQSKDMFTRRPKIPSTNQPAYPREQFSPVSAGQDPGVESVHSPTSPGPQSPRPPRKAPPQPPIPVPRPVQQNAQGPGYHTRGTSDPFSERQAFAQNHSGRMMNHDHVRPAEMYDHVDETSSTTSTPVESIRQEEVPNFPMNDNNTTKRKKRGFLSVIN